MEERRKGGGGEPVPRVTSNSPRVWAESAAELALSGSFLPTLISGDRPPRIFAEDVRSWGSRLERRLTRLHAIYSCYLTTSELGINSGRRLDVSGGS